MNIYEKTPYKLFNRMTRSDFEEMGFTYQLGIFFIERPGFQVQIDHEGTVWKAEGKGGWEECEVVDSLDLAYLIKE